MANLFAKAKAYLPAALENAAGVTVAISYGGNTGNTVAVIGRTVFSMNQPGRARIEYGQRDFLVTPANLVAAHASFTAPAVGMRFTVSGESTVYECRQPDGIEPAWRWSDPQETTYRIHTVQVDE